MKIQGLDHDFILGEVRFFLDVQNIRMDVRFERFRPRLGTRVSYPTTTI